MRRARRLLALYIESAAREEVNAQTAHFLYLSAGRVRLTGCATPPRKPPTPYLRHNPCRRFAAEDVSIRTHSSPGLGGEPEATAAARSPPAPPLNEAVSEKFLGQQQQR